MVILPVFQTIVIRDGGSAFDKVGRLNRQRIADTYEGYLLSGYFYLD